MLRANVGISRKITRDYNSTGYSVNIDGEIAASVDDPDAVVERIRELWGLAEEALAKEIERDQGEGAIARTDEVSDRATALPPVADRGQTASRPGASPAQGSNPRNTEPATDKQIRYLENLAKRQGIGPRELDAKIAHVIGRMVTISQLTKREAGAVIDALTQNGAATAAGNGRK